MLHLGENFMCTETPLCMWTTSQIRVVARRAAQHLKHHRTPRGMPPYAAPGRGLYVHRDATLYFDNLSDPRCGSSGCTAPEASQDPPRDAPLCCTWARTLCTPTRHSVWTTSQIRVVARRAAQHLKHHRT